jgi:transposase
MSTRSHQQAAPQDVFEQLPASLPPGFERINLNAAGIDVGGKRHWVAVPADRDPQPVQSFESFTTDLHRLIAWLKKCRIDTVVMESTGVLWIPLFQLLEADGFEVLLVNAAHVKNVPGRKTDIFDCQWLQILHSFGLLRGSFRPDDHTCVLRSYLRQRQTLVASAARQIQHMQKAMTQMNIQLQHVLSDITGVTGMAIVRAIIAGERDPIALAQLRDARVKSSQETIAKALEGDWRDEHLFALKQAVELYDVYQLKVSECEQMIQQQLEQYPEKVDPSVTPPPPTPKRRRGLKGKGKAAEQTRTLVYRATGVDLTAIDGIDALTAQALIGEIGLDMSRFPSEKQFTSWLRLAPRPKISGGKVLSNRGPKGLNRAGQILRVAANAAANSDSAIGAFCRRLRARLGPAKAIKATANRLGKLVYRALKYGSAYVDIGANAYEEQFQQRKLAQLKRTASELGMKLVDAAP